MLHTKDCMLSQLLSTEAVHDNKWQHTNFGHLLVRRVNSREAENAVLAGWLECLWCVQIRAFGIDRQQNEVMQPSVVFNSFVGVSLAEQTFYPSLLPETLCCAYLDAEVACHRNTGRFECLTEPYIFLMARKSCDFTVSMWDVCCCAWAVVCLLWLMRAFEVVSMSWKMYFSKAPMK